MSLRVSLPGAVHDRLFFAQVREDPRAELTALHPGLDDDVVVVSSGGCTALSLLSAGAGRVVAVDLNATQNHLVELKAAAATLGAREAIAFLGALPSTRRRETYASLRDALSPVARRYWDNRASVVEAGVLRAGVSERFIAGVVAALKLVVHPTARVERLLACRTLDEQRTLFEREWSTRRWRALFALLCNRAMLRNTYPAQFFEHVENPRVEAEEHYYNPVHSKLLDLGLEPSYLGDELVRSMLTTIERHRDRVIDSAIDPRTQWRPSQEPAGTR